MGYVLGKQRDLRGSHRTMAEKEGGARTRRAGRLGRSVDREIRGREGMIRNGEGEGWKEKAKRLKERKAKKRGVEKVQEGRENRGGEYLGIWVKRGL